MKNGSCFFALLIALFLINQTTTGQIQEPPAVLADAEITNEAYTGIATKAYPDGRPRYWKTLVNGKAEGLWLEWYPNGQLRYRAFWKNDMGNGRWEYFYPNGQLRSESFYIDDLAQGSYRSFHQNGQLATDATYLNGKKEGVVLAYDVDGILLSRKRYEKDVQVIDEPLVFQKGVISKTNCSEWGINFMPDGRTAYFTRRNLETGEKRIYKTNQTNVGWSEPVIASFSTDEDEGPFIRADGSQLYFASYRPLPDGSTTEEMDMNLWMMDNLGDSWSKPKPVPGAVNKSMKAGNIWPANYEAGPVVDAEGNLFFWTKGSKNNGSNLFRANLLKDGNFGKPIELIPPSSHNGFDSGPQLSPDGNILFFGASDREDSYGGTDIYYSKKRDGKWSEPKNLGPLVNSSRYDSCPSFSPDGTYFYFSSNRSNTVNSDGEYEWDLYYMETRFLIIE